MNTIGYWNNALQRYSKKEWVHKPTVFAGQAIEYFPSGGSLLELGAGFGQDALFFAHQGYTVHVTDLVRTGIDVCKKKAKEANLDIL